MKPQGTAIVQLGKFGDIANLIPVAKHLHDRGETPHWVVSINYMGILTGVDYVKIDPVHHHVTRIKEALQYASAKYAVVLNGQPYGKDYHGPKDDSYNVLAWKSVGFGEQFGNTEQFPLVFNHRSKERESVLAERHGCAEPGAPIVLLAIGCIRSSPFPSREIFAESIRRKHGHRCRIIDLCEVKATQIYDMLGLFERASLLITGDTYALHLATAVPQLPVIALVNDKPFLASTPRREVKLKLKYSEAIERMKDVHQAVSETLNEEIHRRLSKPIRAWGSGVIVPELSYPHHPTD